MSGLSAYESMIFEPQPDRFLFEGTVSEETASAGENNKSEVGGFGQQGKINGR